MIAIEAHDEKPNIETITCGGMRTRVDVMEQGNTIY
jgi:hypothetical protein